MLRIISIGLTIAIIMAWPLALPVQAKETIKMSLGQYRIADSLGSYWYTPVSASYKNKQYKARLSLPYISDYQGRSGLGNMTAKFTYLTQWKSLYIDIHAKQKWDTAKSSLTLPVKDRAASVEVSGYAFGGVAFIELGHWWRKNYATDQESDEEESEGEKAQVSERENSFYYVLGAVYPIKKGWISGLVLDYKPTALGKLDRMVSALLQYKISVKQKVSGTVGKGLSSSSPDWITGLNWSVKY